MKDESFQNEYKKQEPHAVIVNGFMYIVTVCIEPYLVR